MLKHTAGKKGMRRMTLAIIVGVLTFAASALLGAGAVHGGVIPAGETMALSWLALALGAGAVGLALPEGGRTGLIAGGLFALCFVLWKLAASDASFWTGLTGAEATLCAVIPWLVSCIFHRRKNANTKRNRGKRRRI